MTMTLLSVVKDVCATVGVTIPASVFSNITGNRTMQEMLSLANEMAQRIAYDNRDWTKLKKQWQFGGGISSFGGDSFELPPDFKRMLLTSNVWRSTDTQTPMQFIPDTDEWFSRRYADEGNNTHGEWTMIGGKIFTWPGFDGTQRLVYLDKNCITLAGGGVGDQFMADGDSFRLDERVLKLGMIWQWKAQKGSPYAEDLGTYGDALTMAMGHDSPGPIIIGRGRPIYRGSSNAWAMP
jgi:hypothetical protein